MRCRRGSGGGNAEEFKKSMAGEVVVTVAIVRMAVVMVAIVMN